MLTRPWLTSMLVGLLAANGLWAQSANLTEAALKDCCVRNELTMELTGTIKVKQNNKDVAFPHQAQARHVFLERFLDVNGSVADKVARYYLTAESVIRFNNDEPARRTLRPACSLMMAQTIKDQVVSYTAKEMLTREEMELTDHFNTMAVSGLLPGKEIDAGIPWKLPNHVVQALCNLTKLTDHSVEGSLVSVKGSIAHGKVVGVAQGIDIGALVSMTINAQFDYDLTQKRIVSLEWSQKDDRKQDPISPAINADVTIKLKRTPIDLPEDKLGTFALVPFPASRTPPSDVTNIRHVDEKKRFLLTYARDWHVTSPDNNLQLVMRLMEQGEFIAQVTISPWKKTDLKKIMPLEEFADLMAQTPGWVIDKVSEREEIKERAKTHHKVYRVMASGELDGIKTWQYFYLVVGTQGEQLVVTFSVTPQQVPRIGTRDLELIRDLAFPE